MTTIISITPLSIAILILLYTSTALAQGSFSGKVVAISDGDTIQVMHEGKPEKIRLSEIDCPEKRLLRQGLGLVEFAGLKGDVRCQVRIKRY